MSLVQLWNIRPPPGDETEGDQFSVAARKMNLIGISVSAQSPDWAYLRLY